MNKTSPGDGGVSVHFGELALPIPSRTRIQTNARMAARLEALKFGAWWSRFNAGGPSVQSAPANDAGGPHG